MNTLAIKNLLKSDLQKNINDLAEFNQLVKAAELNNWQINKRILKHLPDGCEYIVEYGMYHVKFPSKNSHLLGWVNSTKELSIESLRHSDSCHSNGSESRIKQLENLLLPENFTKFVKLFINLQKSVSAVIGAMDSIKENKQDGFYNPIYYPLLKMAGISQNAWFELDDIRTGRK